ncbi:hypothetical protein GCM10023096_60910 [Nonomuraea ferruginea]
MSAALPVLRTDLGVRIVTVTLPDLRPVLGVTFRLLRTDLGGGIVSAALPDLHPASGGGVVTLTPCSSGLTSAVGS